MATEEKMNILLVDDRPENLVALESVLSDLDQNLVKASSGREALKYLLQDDFAVILLDVQMPGMDGFETASLIRSRTRTQHTPIVFLTAINKTDNAVAHGYSVGGIDYVFKPFVPEVLKAKVSAFVELARKTQQLELEVQHRQRAEEQVRKLNRDLERRVRERTAELEEANRQEKAARAEAEAAQQRLAFLGEVSEILASSLDYHSTLEQMARQALPYMGDFCIVDVVEKGGNVRRTATAHLDPGKAGLLRELQHQYAPDWDSPQPATRVLRAARPELVPQVDDGWLARASRDPNHLRIWQELAPRTYMAVPLLARGEVVGVLSFGAQDRTYTEDDLRLATDLARRAAVAIDNACLFREVDDAGRRKDEFLAMLAHELRNPLAAIANAEYVLDEIGSSDPRITRLNSVIGRQTRHLSRLVDDLLDISRITRGKIELRREAVELAAAALRATETCRTLIETREHELIINVPEEPLWLDADPTRLEQIIWNLLNNAAKYTDPGGRIWLSAERRDEEGQAWAVVRVRDTGLGISAELMPRVFELFTQAEPTLDRSEGGLGIGLALVRALVQMHGGTITAYSDGPGRGSEFVVRLPAESADFAPAAAEPPAQQTTAGQPLRVLVVEDNPDAAETLCEILDLWGHEVHVVGDGNAALADAPRYRPEVVLLDIGLPGMDGYEVARRLRSQRNMQDAVMIALTGYGQEEDRRRAEDAGFDTHMTKPVDPVELGRLLSGVPEQVKLRNP